VREPGAIASALDEYDDLGAPAFHGKYGFGSADEYLIVARDRLYPSKAILAAAQGYDDAGLGPALNDFSGGGAVQRRLEQLGFEVIRDRRCGNLLKLLSAIRTDSDGESHRVYKPLLLLVGMRRAVAGEARLAPFADYEASLEPLFQRFAEGHSDVALPNAWWRLPGDGLWEVVGDAGAVERTAGERARTNPPAKSELLRQSGGLPEEFYYAVREVPALANTAAELVVQRYFAGRAPEDTGALRRLVAAPADPGSRDIHLVVKWSSSHEPETIARHQEVVERHGAVWWALFSQSSERRLAQPRVDELRGQLAAGRDTFVFVSGETCWRTRLQQLETERDQVELDLVPSYYGRVAGEQFLWLKISDFKRVERDELVRTLDPAANPGRPLALGNQTNPLIVRLRTTPRIWWVAQGDSFKRATQGGHLWAPVVDKAGRPREHWQAMRHLRGGDVVLNYADTKIRGWSVVRGDPYSAPRPDPEADQGWSDEGVRADVEYNALDTPVDISEIPVDWRVTEGGPFDKNGQAKQGYLFPVADDFARKLGARFPALMPALAALGTIAPQKRTSVNSTATPPGLTQITERIQAAGLNLSADTIRRYHLSLKTRGFVILAGVSGSGKTWLAEAYADAVDGENLVVAVAPNWTTNEDLLGYLNPLDNHYYDTDFSLFLRTAAADWKQAQQESRSPASYYLVLDEMNLARVEYYFAKFLSAMERRARHEDAVLELSPRQEDHVLLPPNLRVTGTVNIDETTFGFADKVYDRAQLIEIPVSRDALSRHLEGRPYRNVLLEIWDALAPVAPFAFRVVDEIAAYVDAAAEVGVAWETALDEQLLQKVLPKIKGTDARLPRALFRFVEISEGNFPMSHAKATALHAAFVEYGFTEFFAV
jgi:MoxR-like ATPase